MNTEMTYRIEFFVPGAAAPQGSKRHIGHGVLLESSKAVGPWRERIALAAHNAATELDDMPLPFDCAIYIALQFVMPRPKSFPKLLPTRAHTKRPDLDKLARAALDALTHVIYLDDAQVVDMHASKRTAERSEIPGVTIAIETAR